MTAKRRKIGDKVDFHCPYDEATLRVDLLSPGYHICPNCRSTFKAPKPLPPLSDDDDEHDAECGTWC